MKTLNETFLDADYNSLKNFKKKCKLSWYKFILLLKARDVQNFIIKKLKIKSSLKGKKLRTIKKTEYINIVLDKDDDN